MVRLKMIDLLFEMWFFSIHYQSVCNLKCNLNQKKRSREKYPLTMSKSNSNTNKDSMVYVIVVDLMGRPYY